MVYDDVGRLLQDLELIVGIIDVGTADRPRRIARLRRAVENAGAWAPLTAPGSGPERGGSSSPREAADREEARRVASTALRDVDLVETLIARLAPDARQLAQLVARNTVTVDHSKLPKPADTVPGCVSCARPRDDGKRKLAGHFNPVADRYKGLGLCVWCGEHRAAEGDVPPLEAVDIYHRQGAQAAGRWLARRKRKAS